MSIISIGGLHHELFQVGDVYLVSESDWMFIYGCVNFQYCYSVGYYVSDKAQLLVRIMRVAYASR